MSNKICSFGRISPGLLLSGLFEYAALPDDDRVEQFLEQAKAFSNTGRYDLASRRCEEALKLDPGNEVARAQLKKMKRENAAQRNGESVEAKVIRPAYPPQHIGRISGSALFK